MTKNITISSNLRGVGFLILGMLIFSLQDVAVKWIGGDYSVLEIVAFRSVVALPINIAWGFLLWGEIPTWLTLLGAGLTLGSGLYILYRERRERTFQGDV